MTYKILKSFRLSPTKKVDTGEDVTLKTKEFSKMFKCNWKLSYQKTTGTASVEPRDWRLFIIYKFGALCQANTPDIGANIPPFKHKCNIWYTT